MKPGKFLSILLTVVAVLIGFSGNVSPADAQTPTLDIYIANTANQCSGKTQCFYNDDPDTPQSVALNKALSFARNPLRMPSSPGPRAQARARFAKRERQLQPPAQPNRSFS